MSGGGRKAHGFGAKGAVPEGDYATHSTDAVLSMYSAKMRRDGAIRARTLGQLTHTDCLGNGGEGGTTGGFVNHPRSTCWCERRVVDTSWDEIAAGQTRSCGSVRCDQLAEQMSVTPLRDAAQSAE